MPAFRFLVADARKRCVLFCLQAASSTWDALGTSQWRLRAEASAAEARMLQARVAALDMVAGAEAELLCGVIAASVDACPWTSFR